MGLALLFLFFCQFQLKIVLILFLLSRWVYLKLHRTFANYYRESWLIRILEDVPFFGPKWSLAKKRIFLENLLTSLVPFIYAYLHAKNQS